MQLFRRVLVIFLGLLCLMSSTPALAHSPDQQPFVKINGVDSKLYTVGSTSLSDIILPQDLAPANYLVGQSISFDLEPNNLPFPAELIPNLQMHWDFGDGTTADQHNVTHTYKKLGSYLVRLTSANPAQGVNSQLLDIILVNVIPRADYQLPSLVIKANGQQSSNPYTDILKFDFAKSISLDASATRSGSSPITDYFWDLGDQQRADGVRVTHTYGTEWSYVSVMLRVKTKDGFQVDAMVQLENPNPIASTTSPTPVASTSANNSGQWFKYLGGIVLLGVIIAGLWKRFKGPKKRR